MKTILLWLCSTLISLYGFSQWQTLGTEGFSTGSPQYLNLAVDNGTPYVAYKDAANGERCTVMKFNGGSWVTVGDAGFTDDIARDQSLVVVDGKPYVSFGDDGNFDKPRVMTYNGTSWEYVGEYVTHSATYGTAMCIHDSIIYVATIGGGNAYLYKFQDSVWSQVSFYPASMGGAQDIDMAIHPTNGTPYITYRDNFNGGKVSVVKPNSSGGFDNVGSLGFSTNQVRTPKIVFKDDVPHITFRDINSDKITVMKYDGGWTVVGSEGFSAGSILSPSIAIHDGKAHVAYSDAVNSDGTTISYYDGAGWSDKESSSASVGKATDQQLVSSDGELYLAYRDWENGEKVTVKQLVECNTSPSVSYADSTLTASISDATYQWIDCSTLTPVAGETSQTFKPTANGSYSVLITKGICSDTSECTNVTVGISSVATMHFRLFPNPATHSITIDSDEPMLSYTILNVSGAVVMKGNARQADINHLALGMYFIEVHTLNGTERSPFVKH